MPRPRGATISLSLFLVVTRGNAGLLASFVAPVLLYFTSAIARAYRRDERFLRAEKLSHFVYPSRAPSYRLVLRDTLDRTTPGLVLCLRIRVYPQRTLRNSYDRSARCNAKLLATVAARWRVVRDANDAAARRRSKPLRSRIRPYNGLSRMKLRDNYVTRGSRSLRIHG